MNIGENGTNVKHKLGKKIIFFFIFYILYGKKKSYYIQMLRHVNCD